MRLYIIGIMIGAIGLVAANQVRAEERCGLKSGGTLTIRSWQVEPAKAGKYAIKAYLDSHDPKTIRKISGSLEFFTGTERILKLPLVFPYPIKFKSHFLQAFERRKLPTAILAHAADVEALACVSAITYADGTSVIFN